MVGLFNGIISLPDSVSIGFIFIFIYGGVTIQFGLNSNTWLVLYYNCSWFQDCVHCGGIPIGTLYFIVYISTALSVVVIYPVYGVGTLGIGSIGINVQLELLMYLAIVFVYQCVHVYLLLLLYIFILFSF